MFVKKALTAALLATAAVAKPLFKRQTSEQIRGVNIGGWLLLEPWITPSIFEQAGGAVDEYTLTQNTPNAQSLLQAHWASFVNETDFQKIAEAGLNLVRIPVGYWAFQKYPGDPYIQGAAEYLDKAIAWAANANLDVWIDLHGAPLSQNGFDNSGQRTTTPGFTSGSSTPFTAGVMAEIAQRYGSKSNVVGIELLNEPMAPYVGRDNIQDYYQQGFDAIRATYDGAVIFSDGFLPPNQWNGFLTGQNSILAHHYYQVFTNDVLQLDWQAHIDKVYADAYYWTSGIDKPVVNGEWSGAMTDCAPALNGWGLGSRYEGTFERVSYNGVYEGSEYIGSCTPINNIDMWSEDFKQATRGYIQAQINVSNRVGGWIFWTLKTEGAPEWDFFKLLQYGVWPST